MAQVKKLQLQGIRSFGPEAGDRQSVEFFSPLTLILGQVAHTGPGSLLSYWAGSSLSYWAR